MKQHGDFQELHVIHQNEQKAHGRLSKKWGWMERQVQYKHFMEYFYLTSASIKQTFLGHWLHTRHQVHGKFIRMRGLHLQTWQASDSSFPVAKGKQFHIFELKFLDMSMKTNIRVVRFSQEAFHAVRSLWDFLNSEKENDIWKTWHLQRGPQALASQALVEMRRGCRSVSLPTSLPNFSHPFVISHYRNG